LDLNQLLVSYEPLEGSNVVEASVVEPTKYSTEFTYFDPPASRCPTEFLEL
jgi:hypothetical protein